MPQLSTVLPTINGPDYHRVAASQTSNALGTIGAVGDVLDGLLVVPVTTSPGAISVTDNGGSAISVFSGGTGSLLALVPFFIPIGARATGQGWLVTTGANVSVLATGNFT